MSNPRGTIFYMKTNVLQDFCICIRVPLSKFKNPGFLDTLLWAILSADNHPLFVALDVNDPSFKVCSLKTKRWEVSMNYISEWVKSKVD